MLGGAAIAVYLSSALLGGHAYFQAMHDVAATNLSGQLFSPHVIRLTFSHLAAIVVALAALAFTILATRWRASAIWAFASLSSSHLSWYLSWGIPYIVLAPAAWATAAFFICWPIAESVIEAPFGRFNAALYLGLAACIPVAEALRHRLHIRHRPVLNVSTVGGYALRPSDLRLPLTPRVARGAADSR